MKFYSKDTNGFYSRAIHGTAIPADAVEISDQKYSQLLEDLSKGAKIAVDNHGNPVAQFPAAPSAAEQLASEKEAGYAKVMRIIGEKRASYLTVMAGQEMIYLAKEAEAKKWLATGAADHHVPDANVYPFLAAESGITAANANALAQLWLTVADGWRTTAAGLEKLRMQAYADITAAKTAEAVASAVAVVVAAL